MRLECCFHPCPFSCNTRSCCGQRDRQTGPLSCPLLLLTHSSPHPTSAPGARGQQRCSSLHGEAHSSRARVVGWAPKAGSELLVPGRGWTCWSCQNLPSSEALVAELDQSQGPELPEPISGPSSCYQPWIGEAGTSLEWRCQIGCCTAVPAPVLEWSPWSLPQRGASASNTTADPPEPALGSNSQNQPCIGPDHPSSKESMPGIGGPACASEPK